MKSVTPVILFGHCCARRYTHREIVVDDMEAVHVKHVSVILFARSLVNIIHETAIISHHMAEMNAEKCRRQCNSIGVSRLCVKT